MKQIDIHTLAQQVRHNVTQPKGMWEMQDPHVEITPSSGALDVNIQADDYHARLHIRQMPWDNKPMLVNHYVNGVYIGTDAPARWQEEDTEQDIAEVLAYRVLAEYEFRNGLIESP